MGSLSPTAFHVKTIAIIGAGPCGLSAAKYLKAQGTFESIVIFDQQDEVGGVWYYSQRPPDPSPVPHQDPFVPLDEFGHRPDDRDAPSFPSAMYEVLHANIPSSLMRFSDQEFPQSAKIYPSRESIHEYLVRYAADVRDLIKFSFQVKDIKLLSDDQGRDKWFLKAASLTNDERVEEVFDAVVIANGHSYIPYIPDRKNMREFHQAYPDVILHSRQFRSAKQFADKKVVVVGNGPSGADIGHQINQECRKPALLSVRSPTPQQLLDYTGCLEVPGIEEFLVEEKGVRFTDGSVETDIDAIMFCTGFLFNYPFFNGLERKLMTTGKGVHGLYKHLFCIQHPTLVFPSINKKTIPWPQSETQAAVFAAVWSNDLDLPTSQEMEEWSKELEERQGESLHLFGPNEDGYYINEFHDWAVKARHLGKEPPRWDDEKFWERSIYAAAKVRFEEQGCQANTLDDLGFRYRPGWKAQ